MISLWPLLLACSIVLCISLWLCGLERKVGQLEATRAALSAEGLELRRMASLAVFLPRSLTRVAHFSGVALGFIALGGALADSRSPFIGVACLAVGVLSAVAFGAWGRRFQGRVRLLRSRAEKAGAAGKVPRRRPFP